MSTRPGVGSRLLRVEELEDRNPASTALDALLGNGWLAPGGGAVPRPAAVDQTPIDPRVLVRQGNPTLPADAGYASATAGRAAPTDTRVPPSATPALGGRTWMGDLESLHVPPVVMEQAGSSLLLGSTPAAGLVVGSPVTPGMTMLPASLASALAAVPSHATPPSTPVLLPTPDAGKVRPIQPYAVAPGMTLTADTYSIPVNANRSSGSVWKKDGSGAELKGIPAVRDFDLNPMRDLTGWDGTGNPPAGPAAADPDVKKMTATVILPQVVNVITVNVIYANANTGGRVRLWTDPTKTTEITNGGTLPGYPSSDFYVEGLTPSAAENDITVRVRSTQLNVTVIAERQLTVVPFQVSMSVQPTANPATVTLLKDGSGQVVGLNSGQQAVNGGAFNGTRPGADFSSYVWRDGATGLPKLIQNVLNVSSVAP